MADDSSTQTANLANGTLPSVQQTPAPASPSFQYKPNEQQPDMVAKAEMERMKADYESKMAELAEQGKKAKELQAKLDEIESQKLAEQGKFKELYEKEQSERRKETQSMRRELARAELKALALGEGILDPDLVNLIPAKSFAWDEETQRYTNLKDLLTEHKTQKPHLYRGSEPTTQTQQPAPSAARPTTGDPSAAPGSTPPQQKPVNQMTRQEYEQYKRSYIRQLAGHR